MEGDCYETLIWSTEKAVLEKIARESGWAHQWLIHQLTEPFLELRSRQIPDQDWLTNTSQNSKIQQLRVIKPVLPILTNPEAKIPFLTCQEMFAFNKKKALNPWELALAYESARGGIQPEEAWQMMEARYKIMRKAVEEGLNGTQLPGPSATFSVACLQAADGEGKTLQRRCSAYDHSVCFSHHGSEKFHGGHCSSTYGRIVRHLPGGSAGYGRFTGNAKEEMVNALLTG